MKIIESSDNLIMKLYGKLSNMNNIVAVVEGMLMAQEYFHANMPKEVVDFLEGLQEVLPFEDDDGEASRDILRDYIKRYEDK